MTTSNITTVERTTKTFTGARKRSSRRQSPRRKLGEIELIEEIGIGGHARVYAGRCADGLRAVKVLEKTEFFARFIAEFQALKQIDSPHVIRVYTCKLKPEAHYVMDMISGTRIEDYRCNVGGKLPPDEVCEIARQICSGLEALHSNGVIHRDLCPGNILRSHDGHITLIDLGIAYTTDEFQKRHKVLGPRETLRAIGTPGFVAPEQRGRNRVKCSPQTDYYSLGVVMYLLLTGEAYKNKKSLRVLDRKYRAFLIQLLADDPESRFRNMDELRVELEELGSCESVKIFDVRTQVLRVLYLLTGFVVVLSLGLLMSVRTTSQPHVNSAVPTDITNRAVPHEGHSKPFGVQLPVREVAAATPIDRQPRSDVPVPALAPDLPVETVLIPGPQRPPETQQDGTETASTARSTTKQKPARNHSAKRTFRKALRRALALCQVPELSVSFEVADGRVDFRFGPEVDEVIRNCVRTSPLPTAGNFRGKL